MKQYDSNENQNKRLNNDGISVEIMQCQGACQSIGR